MVILYIILIALVLGLALNFMSFILENLGIVIIVVAIIIALIFGISYLKERIADEIAVKQIRKRRADIHKDLEKSRNFKSADELPEDKDVLAALVKDCEKKGDRERQFIAAQKLYEVSDDGIMLSKCYFDGIGTEKNTEKAKELQKETIAKRMAYLNGYNALTIWNNWWKGTEYRVDLQAMLEIARDFCEKKNPLGIGFMEDVQLAIASKLPEKSLAGNTWRYRLGYEPYTVHHLGHRVLNKDELPDESSTEKYNVTAYLLNKECAFAVNTTLSDEKLKALQNKLKSELNYRLPYPKQIEKDAIARAEKIWESIRKFESAKEALEAGREKEAEAVMNDLKDSTEGFSLIWLLRNQASRNIPAAYFKLSELHRNKAYIFAFDKTDYRQSGIAKSLETKGAEIYRTKAINGNADAQYHHAIHLEQAAYGITPAPDLAKALEFLRNAASRNHLLSMGELLNMVDFGVSFEEADTYAKWIEENCTTIDTFEERAVMRALIAYKIRRKLSAEWTILRKTKEEAPGSNAKECYELAKKYVELDLTDVKAGNIKTATFKEVGFIKCADQIYRNDLHDIYILLYEYTLRISNLIFYKYNNPFEWEREYYNKGRVKEVLKLNRHPIYEFDIISAALTQYYASIFWEPAQAGNIDAIYELCKMFSDRNFDNVRKGINVFADTLTYWCNAAAKTGTARGYYIAGYYNNDSNYLRMAADMGYEAAIKELEELDDLERRKAETDRLYSTPYRSESHSSERNSFEDSNPMDDYNSNHSCKNMPNTIYDSSNNTWRKMHAYENSAVYRNDELGEETITYCDISSKTASGYSRSFHWW